MSAEPSVLFVCLGNICRSASAEAVLRSRAKLAGLSIRVDSAGTGNWHVGQLPDARAIAAAAARGFDMGALRARQVNAADFTRFTHIFAMDQSNLADLLAMYPPGGTRPVLLLDVMPDSVGRNVPDPYYGGPEGFEAMLDLIEDAIDAFLVTASQAMGGRS